MKLQIGDKMDLVNEKYCVFKLTVETAAVVPKPVWKRATRIIVAKNQQDALDVYNPGVTGAFGAMHKIIDCEEIGPIDYVVTDEMKAMWRREAEIVREESKKALKNLSEEDLMYILSHGTRIDRPWTTEEMKLLDKAQPMTAEESTKFANRLKELGRKNQAKNKS